MQPFKPEFGNSKHIRIVEEEIKRQKIEEILEEYPDDIVSREEYDKLKNNFGDTLSHVFKSLGEIIMANEKTALLQDYVDELISELKYS